MLPAAVRAAEEGVILHNAQYRHVQHLRHVNRLGDDHAHQGLGGGDDNHPVHRQGLEHRQGHVPRPGGHIHKQIVQLAPHHVGPELLHRPGDDGATPHHRVGLVLDEQVQAHQLDAALGDGGQDAVLVPQRPPVDVKRLGHRRAGDIGVQNAHLLPPGGHGGGQGAGRGGLAHAPRAAVHGDHLFDVGVGVGRLAQILGLGALPAALAAGGAVMGALAHVATSPCLAPHKIGGKNFLKKYLDR